MGYKVVGTLKHDDEVFEHGDPVTASKVGGEDNFKALVAAKSVVSDEEFEQVYPAAERGVNDPSGTPSNLQVVEGTKLQANMPKAGDEQPAEKPKASSPNPANPPAVKGAGDSKAAAKEQEKKS